MKCHCVWELYSNIKPQIEPVRYVSYFNYLMQNKVLKSHILIIFKWIYRSGRLQWEKSRCALQPEAISLFPPMPFLAFQLMLVTTESLTGKPLIIVQLFNLTLYAPFYGFLLGLTGSLISNFYLSLHSVDIWSACHLCSMNTQSDDLCFVRSNRIEWFTYTSDSFILFPCKLLPKQGAVFYPD